MELRRKPLIWIGSKPIERYKDLIVRADLGLHEEVLDVLQARLGNGAHILDWGSGEGALSQRLVDAGFQVTAVDVRAEDFQCQAASFVAIDFNDREAVARFVAEHAQRFDAVVGVEVVEHLENPWDYVRSMHEMLKPEGWLVLTTPNVASWLSRCMFFFRGRFHQFDEADLVYGHINPISPWELEVILKGVGFRDVEMKGAGTLPPIYLTKSKRMLLMNAFALIMRPFMRGILDGWCVLATAQKPR